MKRCNLFQLVALLAVLIASAGQVQAAVIFDNGLAVNDQMSGYYSSEFQNWRVYDDFDLGTNSTVTDVFFQMGLTSGPVDGSFSFSIYNYLGGNNIGSLIHSEVLTNGDYSAEVNTLSSYPFGPFYDISFTLAAPVSLAAGDYAVSFYGLGAMDFRTPNTGSGNDFYQLEGDALIYVLGGNTPFTLFDNSQGGVVPEPSSLAIFGIGAYVAGIGAVRRRRREKQQETTA